MPASKVSITFANQSTAKFPRRRSSRMSWELLGLSSSAPCHPAERRSLCLPHARFGVSQRSQRICPASGSDRSVAVGGLEGAPTLSEYFVGADSLRAADLGCLSHALARRHHCGERNSDAGRQEPRRLGGNSHRRGPCICLNAGA